MAVTGTDPSPGAVVLPAAAPGPVWSPSHDDLAAAFVAALGELSDVVRSSTADAGTYSYRYADLGKVLGAARPILAAHGLALWQVPVVDGRDVAVETTVMHTSGQWITFPALCLPAGTSAQQAGSAITYARRYAALAVLGMATEDDDGAAAGTRPPPALMSQSNVDRFRQAAADAGLDGEAIRAIVDMATGQRTDVVEEVHASEVAGLRAAFDQYVHTRAGSPDAST